MISRRDLSKGLAFASLALPYRRAFAQRRDAALADDCGVTSGSPRVDGFHLWTRVPSAFQPSGGGDLDVGYEVATSPDFERSAIVARGTETTSAARDFTVRPRVDGLRSNSFYYYRFTTSTGYASETGRARTAPSGAEASSLLLATVSCQAFSVGTYAAYLGLVRESVDFVVHLGDHIYEKDAGRPGLPDPLGGRAATSLDDYRAKYRQYLGDPAYRAARRQFTWIDIWDDHEVFNDYTTVDVGAGPRRASAAYQAFAEYMPIPSELGVDAASGRPTVQMYRNWALGDLVDVVALDERQFRGAKACSQDFLTRPCAANAGADRTMLGAAQKAWLKDTLGASRSAWRFVLSEVMLSSFKAPATARRNDELGRELFGDHARQVGDVILNLDAWDGFPAERQELLDFLATERIDNVAVLTGDIHSAYDSVVTRDLANGAPVAVEIVGAAISSWPLDGSLRRHFGERTEAAVRGANPQFKWFDLASNGYTLVRVTREALDVSHVGVTTITDAQSPVRVVRHARVPAGTPTFA
jgi:alkaline phosphatase D